MKNIMNITELSTINEKNNMFNKEEELVFEDIKETLLSINYEYISKNQEELNNKVKDLTDKMKIIIENHKNNLKIINNKITIYQSTTKDVENIFDKF